MMPLVYLLEVVARKLANLSNFVAGGLCRSLNLYVVANFCGP